MELRYNNESLKCDILDKVFYEKRSESYERYIYILRILLENRFTYTTQLFAEELYCSKSTILKDLIYVEEWLNNRKIQLVKKTSQGISIVGEEDNLRKAMIDLYRLVDYSNEEVEEEKNLDIRLDSKAFTKLKELFGEIDLLVIHDIVKKAELELECFFTKEGFINLIMHIGVTISRLKYNQPINIHEESFKEIINTKEFEVAEKTVNELQDKFKVTIPIEETAYIALHMLGTKVQENSLKNVDTNYDSSKEYYIKIAKRIIKIIGDVLGEDIENDTVLEKSLALHLKPTIVRLKNGISIENPLLTEIKSKLKDVFRATWACNSIFQEELGVLINEDEVAYLTLHIASSLERVKKKVKVVIVCPSGVGTSQFLASKLENKFDNIEIIAITPFVYLNKQLIDECDFIISTMKIQDEALKEKMIFVSALVSEDDINKIKEKIFLKRKKKSINEVIKIEGIIDKGFCFKCDKDMTFEEIINEYGNVLIKEGYAKQGFVENVIKREKVSSTCIGGKIAIPHAVEEYVNESKVCVIKLKEPINLRNEVVDLIFLLCLKFGDIKLTRDFFKGFYRVINDENLMSKIRSDFEGNKIEEIFEVGR